LQTCTDRHGRLSRGDRANGGRDRREARAALAGLLIATYLEMDRHPDVTLLERARAALDEAIGSQDAPRTGAK
jgi:hypothetical protein